MATLAANGVKGTLFVHEITEVRPGTALEYLDAVQASTSDVSGSVKHNFDTIVAAVHEVPVPKCP